MEVVASLSQGRTAAAQCGLFTNKSFPVIFEPPCTNQIPNPSNSHEKLNTVYMNDKDSLENAKLSGQFIM